MFVLLMGRHNCASAPWPTNYSLSLHLSEGDSNAVTMQHPEFRISSLKFCGGEISTLVIADYLGLGDGGRHRILYRAGVVPDGGALHTDGQSRPSLSFHLCRGGVQTLW